MAGRTTKLNPKTQRAFIDALKIGLSRSAACGHAQVSNRTFLTWIERGKKAKSGEFLLFLQSVEAAEDYAASRMEGKIIKAADNDPKYALEWLKRRRRLEWGDNIAVTADREFAATLAALEAGTKGEV